MEKIGFLGREISWDDDVSVGERVYLVDRNYVCTNFEEAIELIETEQQTSRAQAR